MTKKPSPLNLKKVEEVKKQEALIQEADILEFFTENYGNDFHTQDSLTLPRSDDDIEGDISRKETSLKN